ncbi:MAG TPA: 3-dehydroquinate synthase, partial [Spirochaetia bacterium]|nr:3-dehydroquinate synthase [Spirochaetia bacterium]
RSNLRNLLETRREEILSVRLSLLEEIVADALSVKAKIVEQDFLENDIRAHLNLGHTFGHALESVTGFQDFTHGEGVAWGIDKAMRTGVRIGATEPGYAKEVTALLGSYGFELGNLPDRASEIVGAMRQDKKKRGGNVRFVLQRSWGETYVAPVDDEIVLSVLTDRG